MDVGTKIKIYNIDMGFNEIEIIKFGITVELEII